jgi:DNA-binding response OmpR family regulator
MSTDRVAGVVRRPLTRIMIVEDDAIARKILVFHLRHIVPNTQIKTFSNGTSFLDTVDMKAIDILFLDIMLPDISGFDILRIMEANCEINMFHIVIYSGCNQHLVKATINSISSNINNIHYAQKPINKKLIKTILFDRISP